MKLRLATRASALAWTQSNLVADALRARGHDVELVRVTTQGDVSRAPLSSLGGVGVFVGAVRSAVLSGEADFAVHSFKDLPAAPAEGLLLAAVPPREDPADALCSAHPGGLAGLPAGARVGTGSPRRAAQLLARRGDLVVVDLRGNVETRLRRIAEDLDAVVLAAAGLRRLGLADAIGESFSPEDFLPAPSQGALAIECRADAPVVAAALAALDDPASRAAALAERAVLTRLEAGCAAPIGAYARLAGGRVLLDAAVLAVDGSRLVRESAEADPAEAEDLGFRVADALVSAGASDLVNLRATKARPLAGVRVLAPDKLPLGTVEGLDAAGAELVQAPFIASEPLPSDALATAAASGADWVVVSSARAVPALAEVGIPAGARVAAVGPATASALAVAGIAVDLIAGGSGAALVDELPGPPGRALLPGAQTPSAQPARGLAERGWEVTAVPVYATRPLPLPAEVVGAWDTFDVLLVTAGSVARAAAASAGTGGPAVVALGQPSAAVARELGFTVAAVAVRPDADALLEAVHAAMAARPGPP